jgi:hypothetical protein
MPTYSIRRIVMEFALLEIDLTDYLSQSERGSRIVQATVGPWLSSDAGVFAAIVDRNCRSA